MSKLVALLEKRRALEKARVSRIQESTARLRTDATSSVEATLRDEARSAHVGFEQAEDPEHHQTSISKVRFGMAGVRIPGGHKVEHEIATHTNTHVDT